MWNPKVLAQDVCRDQTKSTMHTVSHEAKRCTRCCFITGDWNANTGSPRDTWSDRQVWPWSTSETGQRLIEFCQEKALVIANTLFPTAQETTLHIDNTRWSTPKSDWLYSLQSKMEKLSTVSKNKTRSWLWLRSWTPYCHIQTEIEESRENH